MMAKFEVEDGEAYYFRGGDDDENIDPDRDFSYIDQKIANVLGQYQKDFMGGISAESLGARFGGYGSFLPMQQRSPPILSNQESQSHATLKSPQDLPSERSHQNPTISANQIPTAKSIPATSDHSVEAVSEPGISSMNSQLKPQCSGELAQNHQTKKSIVNNSGKNSLKFRFKMAPENISNLDKSAIYSGLGLDISPSPSPEGSPSENDETSAGVQEMNVDSPSYIIKIMTSIPISDNDLLSPLQDSLVNLKEKVDYAVTALPGLREELPVNIVQENMYMKGKKEEKKDRKLKVAKDTSKVKRSKQKEASKERELKQKAQSQKPIEMIKDNSEYAANKSSATSTEENGASIAREVVSNAFTSEVGAYSEEKDCASLMNKSFDNDIGSPVKQVHVDRKKAKDEPFSAKKPDAMDNDENGVSSHGKTEDRDPFFVPMSDDFTEHRDEDGWGEDEVNKFPKQYDISKHIVKEEALESAHSKDKNVIFIPKSESSSEKRKEGRGKKEGKEFLKQQSTAKDHVKEEVVGSVCPIRPSVHGKENGFLKTTPKNEEMGLISSKNEEDKYNDVSREMKYDDVEKVESSKQKARSREITRSLAEQGLLSEKENLSSAVKKKLKDSQIGVSSVEPPRGNLVACSSALKNEGVNSRISMPPKNKGGTDKRREMRKSNEVAGKAYPRKKGKEGNSRDFGMEVPEQQAQPLPMPTKLKDKSSAMKTSSASNVGSNIQGDLTHIISEKAPVDVPPTVNAQPVTYVEDWVLCEKCQKWRLLPLGMSANSLTEIWTCSMITWLPGMNKCSFSEDDTTNALRALYVPVESASLVPNSEPVYQDGSGSVNVRVGTLNVGLPSQASGSDTLPTGSKKKNFVKTNIDAVRQTAVQDFRAPITKDKVRSEMRNSKNLKKLPRESDSVRKSGDVRPPKVGKKRLADVDAYGVPKKMKGVREQSVEAYNPGPLRIPHNSAKGSPKYPLVKDKKRTQSDMMSKEGDTFNEPGKKRKIKDKQQRDYSAVASSGKGGHLDAGKYSETEHRNEKKLKPSYAQARESSTAKGNHRTQSEDAIANLPGGGDSSLHKGGKAAKQFHVDRVSRKAPGGRTSEMALDMGLSDNATTSSSSKVSCKVKAKVKSSPAGSTSSSPLKTSKPDPDRGTSKKSVSYTEQRLRSGAESAANDCAPPNELFRDRKSNLSRNSGITSDTANDDHFVNKVSSGRHSSSRVIDELPKHEDLKHIGGKLDPLYEGISTSQRNLVTKSPHKLHLDGTNTEKGRSHASKIDNEKEVSSNARDGPECEGGSDTIGGRSDNVIGKPSAKVVVGHDSLRTSHHTGPATTTSDVEASSSRKKDSSHRAANTALREAKDLKHSANCLKVSGSGIESTGVSFQAALKFLHGASLLEPGNSEGRGGEMTPNEVYTSTAKLCENCALEFERCNDMASAALAYKCMEVAYMRLVYCNDLAASRDRQELQMAVRVAPLGNGTVESPSSSASDIDNLNQAAMDSVKDGHSAMDQRSHVVSAGNRPNFMRLLDFTHDINLAMEASRRSQSAFAAAMPVLTQAGNVEGNSSIKRVLDFSFHDIDEFLHLVRLAMESIKC